MKNRSPGPMSGVVAKVQPKRATQGDGDLARATNPYTASDQQKRNQAQEEFMAPEQAERGSNEKSGAV